MISTCRIQRACLWVALMAIAPAIMSASLAQAVGSTAVPAQPIAAAAPEATEPASVAPVQPGPVPGRCSTVWGGQGSGFFGGGPGGGGGAYGGGGGMVGGYGSSGGYGGSYGVAHSAGKRDSVPPVVIEYSSP